MSRLALPADVAGSSPQLGAVGNAGLFWNRFCDQWQPWDRRKGNGEWAFSGLAEPDRQTQQGGGKLLWIKRLADKAVGDPALLREHADRLEALLNAHGQRSHDLALAGPMVTGTGLEHPVENGFLFHHTLGVPYLPGSGIKGLIRAWAADVLVEDEGDVTRVLGSSAEGGCVGSVAVLDALPLGPVRLAAEIMTPHYQRWHQARTDPAGSPPGDWWDPVPIPFLAVDGRHRPVFRFALLPNPTPRARRKDLEDATRWLEGALDWLGAGAKTAIGFGRFVAAATPAPAIPAPGDGAPGGGRRPPAGHSVYGDAVDIVRRELGRVLVRYRRGGREGWVEPDEIEPL